MAEIRTAISIGDGFTPNLRKLERGLGAVLSTYQSLAKAFGKPLHLKVSKSTVTKLNSETAELGKTQLKTNEALNRSVNSFRRAANGAYAAATAYSRFNRVAQQLNGTLRGLPRGRSFTMPRTSSARTNTSARTSSATMNNFARATEAATKKQRLFNTSIILGNSLHAKFTSGLRAMAGAYLLYQGAVKAMSISDSLANLKGGFNLITPDRKMNFDQYFRDVAAIAKESRTGIFNTGEMLKRMALNTGDIFKDASGRTNMNELYGFTATFQKMLRLGNLKTSERDSAILQFTQAMGAGVLQGDEFRSISENAQLIKKAVADFMGVSTGALKELSSEGKITAEIMKGAILSMVDEVDAKLALLPRTFADAWTDFKNNATIAFKSVMDMLGEFSNSQTMVKLLDLANIAVIALAKGVMLLIQGFQGLYNIIKNNFDIIAPILIAATTAMLAFGAATLYARYCALMEAVASWTATTAKIAYAAATRGFGVAARFAAKQQRSLTAAMLANPIGRIVALAFALVGLIYAGIVAWHRYKGESSSVFSTLVGGIGVVVEVFKTAGKALYYALAWAWYALKGDFWELLSDLDEGWHSLANSIANAMILAVNMILAAWNNLADILPNYVKEKSGIKHAEYYDYHKNDYVSPLRKNVEYNRAQQKIFDDLQSKNILGLSQRIKDAYALWKQNAQAFEEKFNSGELIEDLKKFLGIVDKSKPYDVDSLMDKYEKVLNNIDKNTGQTAKNTGGLDINSEEIVWMREIGEREAVNRFTTAEVKVEVVNNNNLKSSLDVNQLMDKFTEKLREGVLTAADAVHY